MSIAPQITAIRHHLTQNRKTFSDFLGISPRTLLNYETGTSIPLATDMARYYQLLSAQVPDLNPTWWFLGLQPMVLGPELERLNAENGLLRAYNAHLRAALSRYEPPETETKAVSHVSLFETKIPVTI